MKHLRRLLLLSMSCVNFLQAEAEVILENFLVQAIQNSDDIKNAESDCEVENRRTPLVTSSNLNLGLQSTLKAGPGKGLPGGLPLTESIGLGLHMDYDLADQLVRSNLKARTQETRVSFCQVNLSYVRQTFIKTCLEKYKEYSLANQQYQDDCLAYDSQKSIYKRQQEKYKQGLVSLFDFQESQIDEIKAVNAITESKSNFDQRKLDLELLAQKKPIAVVGKIPQYKPIQCEISKYLPVIQSKISNAKPIDNKSIQLSQITLEQKKLVKYYDDSSLLRDLSISPFLDAGGSTSASQTLKYKARYPWAPTYAFGIQLSLPLLDNGTRDFDAFVRASDAAKAERALMTLNAQFTVGFKKFSTNFEALKVRDQNNAKALDLIRQRWEAGQSRYNQGKIIFKDLMDIQNQLKLRESEQSRICFGFFQLYVDVLADTGVLEENVVAKKG